MLNSSLKKKVSVEEASENLVNFSIDRNDLMLILKDFPQEAEINLVGIEYEIQLLKILSVGWGISFFMGESPKKKELTETFWNTINAFSNNISSVTSSAIGKDIDYFKILKERIDIYVNALTVFLDVSDPASVIGPTFAKLCGNEEDSRTISAGKKVFNSSIGGVRDYLESIEIQ